MSYPYRWASNLDNAIRAGDPVPLREELVPTDDDGRAIPPGDDVLVNMDINYNNSKPSLGLKGAIDLQGCSSHDR